MVYKGHCLKKKDLTDNLFITLYVMAGGGDGGRLACPVPEE